MARGSSNEYYLFLGTENGRAKLRMASQHLHNSVVISRITAKDDIFLHH